MKFKKEYIVLVLVIAALSVYLVVRQRDRTGYTLPELPAVASGALTRIELTKGERRIELAKQDGRWSIVPQGFPVDKDRIRGMLDVLADLTLTAMVSEAGRYGRYELDAGRRVTVKAWAGSQLKRHFEVGKAAPSYRHTFVRLPDDRRVYHARNHFRLKFDKTVAELRDATVMAFAPDAIESIAIATSDEGIRFERSVGKDTAQSRPEEEASAPSGDEAAPVAVQWIAADGRKGDKKKLRRLLETLADLQCDAFINDRKKEDFGDPLQRVTLEGGGTYTLSIFAQLEADSDQWPAVSSYSDYPFMLSDWHLQRIRHEPGWWLADPAETPVPEEPDEQG